MENAHDEINGKSVFHTRWNAQKSDRGKGRADPEIKEPEMRKKKEKGMNLLLKCI